MKRIIGRGLGIRDRVWSRAPQYKMAEDRIDKVINW